jgi:hypothetical protein
MIVLAWAPDPVVPPAQYHDETDAEATGMVEALNDEGAAGGGGDPTAWSMRAAPTTTATTATTMASRRPATWSLSCRL